MLFRSVLVAVLVGKVLVTGIAGRLAGVGRPWQLAVGTGQIGELSFVLTSLLVSAGLLDTEIYSAVLTAVVISIAISTVVVRLHWTRSPAPAVL